MKNLLRDYISKLDTFSYEEVNAIVEKTEVGSFKKGEIILREGQICDKCYFVLKGCVRQFQLVDGEEKTTAFFTEGQPAIQYSSYLNGSSSKYYLSCVENSVLIIGTRESEKELHTQFPKLEFMVSTLMQKDFYTAQEHIALLNNFTPEERYLKFMETRSDLLNRVPLHQIASFLGITPESLSRIRKRILSKEHSKK